VLDGDQRLDDVLDVCCNVCLYILMKVQFSFNKKNKNKNM
jgi:hypothetical protein